MDYMVYAYLQLGQDAKAKAVVDDMMTVTGFTETFLQGLCVGSFARTLCDRALRLDGGGGAQVRPARWQCRRLRISRDLVPRV